MALTLAFDIGTTNLKAGIVDPEGHILESASAQLNIERPEARAAEHNPEELLALLLKLGQQVSTPHKQNIKIISVSTYQFGLILLSKDFRALTGITTLLDTRARVTYEEFKASADMAKIYQKTGCPPFTQYPLARLFYFHKKYPHLLEQAAYVLSGKAFVLHKLTGELFSDPSTEAASQLLNMHSRQWDEELLNSLGLGVQQFPALHDALAARFPILPEIQQALGLPEAVPVIPGLYDGGALAVGLGGLQTERGVINIGTSGMLRVVTPRPVLDKPELMRLQTYYLMDGLYFAGGAVNNATLPLNWLKTHLTHGEY